MVSIGEGNKQAALRESQALGATNLIVHSLKPPESNPMCARLNTVLARYGIRRDDLRRLKASWPWVSDMVPLKAVGDEMLYRDKRLTSQAFGTTPDLLRVANLRLDRGRYLSQVDLDKNLPVAVIGSEVAAKFFPNEDPIDKVIRIKDQAFKVIGILQPIGLAGGRGSALVGRDLNKDVHIPMTTAETQFGDQIQRRVAGSFLNEEVQLSEVFITSPGTDTVLRDAALVRQIIRAGHPEFNDVQLI